MRIKTHQNIFWIIVITMLMTTVLVAPSITSAKAQSLETLPQDLESLLSDYSQYLETGTTSQKENYSSQMALLVTERQEFYREFFEKGLHSNLVSLESQFVTNQNVAIDQRGDVYYVNLVEVVTMSGESITTSPEKYPLIQAARWSLTQTDNANVKRELNHYIETMTRGVNESVKEGVEIVFVVNHNIEINNEKGQLQIVQDTFTDKAIDNGNGYDNIIWEGNEFERKKPDWASMIDYTMYHTTIESLGKELLVNYETVFDKPAPEVGSRGSYIYYQRCSVRWYARQYSSNTDLSGGCPHYNPNYYKASYQYLWSQMGCNDCTDFASQAIRHGGFSPDGVWYPQYSSWAWKGVGNLWNYLASDTYYYGTIPIYNSMTGVTFGDLAFVGSSHVGVITSVNPNRFSGHTNDRVDYPMNGSNFNKYIHFWYRIWRY